ncbi:MAG: UbiA family prenyltransferase [Planctomycetota bacterium]|nr:UbiA family prenyltransferase [Planctomycetota bacterium]
MNKPNLRDYLVISRAPLAFTALADGLLGLGLALASLENAEPIERVLFTALLVALSSSFAYLGGMVFNDIFDRERDKELNPKRPLPSGRMSLSQALIFGGGLILASSALAFATSFEAWLWHCALLAAIFAYDGFFKRFRAPGAVAMAACRGFNILFGAATMMSIKAPDFQALSSSDTVTFMAFASFIYIFALTMLSTYEDEEASKGALLVNGALLLFAPVSLCALKMRFGLPPAFVDAWVDVLGLMIEQALMLLILALLLNAWKRGSQATGHNTTRWLIRGTLLLGSGALILAGSPFFALFNLALAVPYVLGARWLFKPRPADVTDN